jgi:hypothetical protein
MQLKKHFLLIITLLFCNLMYSQKNYWTKTDETGLRSLSGERWIVPKKYLVYSLDIDALYRSLNTEKAERNGTDFTLDFPDPDGRMHSYRMTETPVFEDGLLQKFPGFTAFTGRRTDRSDAYLKMSVSPFSIHVMVLMDGADNIFIDPYTSESKIEYIVYYKSDYEKPAAAKKFFCGTEAHNKDHSVFHLPEGLKRETDNQSMPGDCRLRTYRLALACTGEYSQFHGGTVEKVLAAYNTAMARVNGVYERDLAITMKLIPNTDTLIFLNASTDPYSNNNGSVMLGQNQTTINNRIGLNNYDIGHVFSTGGGGIASLGSPCTNRRAQGVTGAAQPINDPFTIDYVAHEIGHQFGANHTQNNNCQRNLPTAMEPGSATTIMGYAGICDPNVQNNSHDYFHAISLNEIANFVVTGAGSTCGTNVAIENSKPVVTIPRTSYTMPISTAFYLRANASDADGDALTYAWEQTDSQSATMPPQATNTTGPSFRSLPPSPSPTRYFPDLLRRYNAWEVLPSVTRTMRFRCTVRDNNPLGGCTHEANVQLNFTNSAGPFIVTNPNTSQVDWKVGTRQTVTWDVANTDIAPINCATVNILLSSDGGASYPDTLAAGVPNSGSYEITVPNRTGTRTRVMVVANDHIFLDVSNFNFRITSSFNVTTPTQKINVCDEESVTLNLNITKSIAGDVQVSLESLSEVHGLQFAFSENDVAAPTTVSLVITGLNNLNPGNNNVEIRANTEIEQIVLTINLFKGLSVFPEQLTINPANFASNVSRFNIPFEWETHPGIDEYEVEIAQNPDFSGNTIKLKSTTGKLNFTLQDRTVFYWRVRGLSPCGIGLYSPLRTFRTGTGSQAILEQNNLLLINPAEEVAITPKELKALATPEANVRFVIMSMPVNGVLTLNGTEIESIGAVFTMEDISEGKVTYRHFGGDDEFDDFRFNLIDPAGLWLPNSTFRIRIRQQNLGIVAFRQNNVSCFGLADGKIIVDVFGGTPPYQYSLDGTEFNQDDDFSDLGMGSYTIYIKDTEDNIAVSELVQITQPAKILFGLSLIGYDIKASASGGSGEFTYSINGNTPVSDNTFRDPGNNLHIIEVTDASGCSVVDSIAIDIPTLVGELDGGVITCHGDRIDFTVRPSGGLPPYNYSVNGGAFQTSPLFKVQAGIFAFNVRDSGGKLLALDTLLLSEPDLIETDIEVSRFEVVIDASGGTGVLSYTLSDNYLPLPDTVIIAENGLHTVTIRDENDCTITADFTISVLNQINPIISDASCFGASDGKIILEVPYGTPPYTFSVSSDGGIVEGDGNSFLVLTPGNYSITVTDALDDEVTTIAEISEPEALELTFGVELNNLNLFAAGGTPPYQYSIDGGNFFVNANQFDGLSDTTYYIVLKDANGCTTMDSVQIKTSSTSDANLSDIMITPNPGNGMFVITSNNPLHESGKITIFDVLGRQVNFATTRSVTGENTSWNIDISHQESGRYFIKLVFSGNLLIKSIIKL